MEQYAVNFSFLFVFFLLQVYICISQQRIDFHSQYYSMCICIRQYHQISGLRLWAVFRRRNVVMGIDVRWVSRGRRDVVSYHKWMTSYNFFDFGVTCSTFISLCPNIRNTGLYFYLAFDFFKLREKWRKYLFTRTKIASRCKMHPLSVEN